MIGTFPVIDNPSGTGNNCDVEPEHFMLRKKKNPEYFAYIPVSLFCGPWRFFSDPES